MLLTAKGALFAPKAGVLAKEKADADGAPNGAGVVCVLPNGDAAWVPPNKLVDAGVDPNAGAKEPPNALVLAAAEDAPNPPPKALAPKAGVLAALKAGALGAAPKAGAAPVEPKPPPKAAGSPEQTNQQHATDMVRMI